MPGTRFFSWKDQGIKKVKVKNEDRYYWVRIPSQNIKISYYGKDFNHYSTSGVGVYFYFYEDTPISPQTRPLFMQVKQKVQIKRGLFQDYLEITAIENIGNKEIEPTLTVNLCFNNRFYFGWLPLFLAILTACVSLFIWKKVRRGKKVDTPKLKI